MKDLDFIVYDMEEVLKNAPICEELIEIEKELAKIDYSEINHKNGKDWSILNSQIVGSEYK